MVRRFHWKNHAFFYERAHCKYSKACLQKFHPNIRRSTAKDQYHVIFNAHFVDFKPKPSNYYQRNYANYTCFPYKSPMFTPVFLDRPWTLAHMFYESLPSRWRMFWFCIFAVNLGSLKTQISQNKMEQKYLAKKKREKNPFDSGWVGAHRTWGPNLRVYFQATAWKLDAEQNWGDMLDWTSLYWKIKKHLPHKLRQRFFFGSPRNQLR